MPRLASSLRCAALFAALIPAVIPAVTRAQDFPTKGGTGKGSAPPPLWSQPDPAEALDLKDMVRELERSILLVGDGEARTGTAWVLSQEHRLLATNAHVADIFHKANGHMVAMINGDDRTFRIEETIYHPGVRRFAGAITFRSTDSSAGGVDTSSPDVAILRIAPGDPLPPALAMATPEELYDLDYESVAMLGFPGHDTKGWPEPGHVPGATFRVGHISRVSDFLNDVTMPAPFLQQLQHSMPSWGGFSGSPIFLTNGHVIGLHNAGETLSNGSRVESLQYGIRVDCVWELLKQSGLWDQVEISAEPTSVDVERFSLPDPVAPLVSQVRRLLAQARIDLNRHDELAAIEKCEAARKIIPNYGPTFDVLSNAYSFLAVYKFKPRSPEAIKCYEASLESATLARKLEPSFDHDIDEMVATMNVVNAKAPSGYQPFPGALEGLDSLIALEHIRFRDRAYAHRARAFALGFSREALADLEKANEIDPWIPQNYATLAVYWDHHRNAAKAKEARDRFAAISAADADSEQAWLAATSTDPDTRNGVFAEQLAEKACLASQYRWWKALRSLAAAHAENGEFDEAVKFAQSALDVAPPEEAGAIRRQLASYEKREAWRDN
jgi:tetratricopeptide (TPR) repeat protein